MPAFTPELQSFSFGALCVQLWVPILGSLRRNLAEHEEAADELFPYWAKLWPSAIAMCGFIAAHPHLVAHKNVLELGAGLGLPGILAAQSAREVTISDHVPEAVAFMRSSVELNGLINVHCAIFNWDALPPGLTADVLLLSDINYDPSAFEILSQVLLGFLSQGTTILLTTPQRLMARPFIERLLPYCVVQQEQLIAQHGEQTFISVLVMSLSGMPLERK